MEHIQNILTDVIKNLEKNERAGSGKINTIWKRVVGEKIAAHTKPYRFKKNVLYVHVDESTWVYELSQKYKPTLIQRLNHELDEKYIHDIYFRVGNIG